MSRSKKNEENPPADRRTTPRVRRDENKTAPEQTLCHIHNKVTNWEADGIRKNVCVNDEPLTEFEGRHYCLFHLPTKDKDVAKFNEIVAQRLKKVDEQCAAIEAEFHDDKEKQSKAKRQRKINYDFRYVLFPSNVYLAERTFSSYANFNAATFSLGANFILATFSSDANFDSASFTLNTDFRSAIFSSDANFNEATFLSKAYFNAVTFSSKAYFISTIFDEKSQIFFNNSKFEGPLNFSFAIIKGYVAFEGKQSNRVFGKDTSLLNLWNARIDDAKKISFHTVRLEASWFINTEARELVFTDCQWAYADGGRLTVKRELEDLIHRGFENPHAVLAKACWQLADNHE